MLTAGPRSHLLAGVDVPVEVGGSRLKRDFLGFVVIAICVEDGGVLTAGEDSRPVGPLSHLLIREDLLLLDTSCLLMSH